MPIEVIDVRKHFADEATQTMKLLVAGPAGAGKTRMASTFPDVLYADAEGRLLSVRDRAVRAVRITSSKTLEELRNALDQRPEIRAKMLGGPVSTVVLDTVDEIADLLMTERKQAERKDAFTQPDWGVYGDKLRDILRGFRNLSDVHVIFNVHLKPSKDDEVGRIEYWPAISGQVGTKITEFVDECFLLRSRARTDPRTGEKVIERYAQTYGDNTYPWLKDHSGALPPEFPIDLTTDYQRITNLIFKVKPDAKGGVSDEKVPAEAAWTPPVEEPPAPLRKKAAVKKKTTVVVEREPELLAEPERTESHPQDAAPEVRDTAVPENGTEIAEPPAEDRPACAVCGTTDINDNYLELSEARWGEFLCRAHFLERNKSK